ncbi:MAG: NlpC/P60 family protein [Tissierellia bacterium]|nr:NlpC/P60 family protein [Tissierellia bacterium]
MSKGKIGLAFGLMAVTSFAALGSANSVTEDLVQITKPINKTVIENFARESVRAKDYHHFAVNMNRGGTQTAKRTAQVVAKAPAQEETVAIQATEEQVVVHTPITVTAPVAQVVEQPVQTSQIVNEQPSVHLSAIEVEEAVPVDETAAEAIPAAGVEVAEATPTATVNADQAPIGDNGEEFEVSLSFTGWVTDNLNIRSGRSTSTEIIGVLDQGAQITGDSKDGWVAINYNGEIGYISESFLSASEAVLPVEEPVVEEPVIEEPVAPEPVIEEPVTPEPVVEEPVYEAPVYEEPVVETPIYNGGGDTVSNIVGAAYSLVGSPYVWAGSSPSTGFDCSGLTSYLYSEYAGVELSRITTGQAGNGYGVSKDSILPGDIILFQNDWSDHVDHVGIYVGDGSYVHAATEERGVVIDSTSGSYFENNVVGVRRILN